MQAGAEGGGEPDRPRRIAGRIGRRPRTAAAGGPADRARCGRPSVAGRGAGGARPGGDRSERSGGQDCSRRRCAGLRSGAAGGGRGAAVRHSRRWPASIGSSRTHWRRSASKCARSSRRIEAGGTSISPSWTASLATARESFCRRCPRARLAAPRSGERGSMPPSLQSLHRLKLDAARFRTAIAPRLSPARRAPIASSSRSPPIPARRSAR